MSNTENAHVYYKYPKTHFTETFLYSFSMGTGSLQISFSEMTTVVDAEDLPSKPVVAVL